MQMRTILIGILALVFGTSAAVGVALFANRAAESPKVQTVPVVVTTQDLNRGQTLATEHLAIQQWPQELVPEGAISDLATVLERTVAIPMVKGDLLMAGKLAQEGAGRGMAAIIPAGMRAVTIQTPNVATGVAGFILPGNKVDILLTMNNQGTEDQTGGGSTITLLQNIEILAVDQQTDVPQDNKMDSNDLRSVTLLVTPSDAAKLDLGQNKGTLRLTLRNPTDKATEFVDVITLAGLNRNPSESLEAPESLPEPVPEAIPVAPIPLVAPEPPPPPVIPQVRTLRGTRSGTTQYGVQTLRPATLPVETVPPPVQTAS